MHSKHEPEEFKLGYKVRDSYTGYEGFIHGIADYITGCRQCLISPRTLDKDGKPNEGQWMDYNRLEILEPAKVKQVKTGGPSRGETPSCNR